MDKRAVQSKFSVQQSPSLFLFISCLLPIGATILDLMRNGLPFALPSVLAVHTTQPLHWVIDSVPFLTFSLIRALARTNSSTTPSRNSASGDGQGPNAAKTGQLVTELKNELVRQRRNEETLRASEEFYRNLVENTNDGIATISVDGIITSVNRGVERMLGRLREEMVGKHYSTLLSVSSLGAVEDRIRRFQSGEKVLSLFDLELLHQNGSPIAVEARTRPITDKNGTTIGFQGVYRAIAKRAVVKKDNGTSTSVSAEATISTAMPWERPATQSNNEGQNQAPLPDGYSPLSRRTETSTTTSISENAEQPQHHGILSSEQSSGSLSTAQGVSSVSSSEPSPVSSPAPAFRIAASASRPSSPVTHAESSTPNSVPPQFTLATDRTKKEDRQVNVVPFSPTSPLGGGPSTPGSLKNSSPQTFNLNEALARVEGDRELLCEMAGVFLDEYPMLLVTMQDALSHGNAQTLTFAVHTLKGSVANFAATNAFEAALRLEKIARQGNLPQAKAALAELEAELIRLVPVLTSLKMEVAA